MKNLFIGILALATLNVSSFALANDDSQFKVGCGIYEVAADSTKTLVSNELIFETRSDDGVIEGAGTLSLDAPEGRREFTLILFISKDNEAGIDGIRSAYVATYILKGDTTNDGTDSNFLVNIKQGKSLFALRNSLTYFTKGTGEDVFFGILRCLVK